MAYTAKSRTDLEIVKIYVQNKWYTITCESISFTHKQDKTERTACDSHVPYEVNYGGEEYSFEIKGIDQSQRWLFERIMMRQSTAKLEHMPSLVAYKYNKSGKLVKDYYWKSCTFDEIKQDGNEPFDVSGNSYDPQDLTSS